MLPQLTCLPKFSQLAKLAASKHAGDLDLMLTYAKVIIDYAAEIDRNVCIAGTAKHKINLLRNACQSFFNSVRSELSEETRVIFDAAHANRDHLAWGQIFLYLADMSPEQIEGVEGFCKAVTDGNATIIFNDQREN